MLENNTMVKVTNRSKSRVTYVIPEIGVRRTFQGNETKEIEWGEIQKLSYADGGLTLIKKFLMIQNPNAVKIVLNDVEPEYYYTQEDVKKLLTTGSLDELLDCLDFAPTGVIDLVKSFAVDLPLNDMEKRQAILEKTGFNVTAAIEIKNTKYDGDSEASQNEEKPKRRVPIDAPKESGRRAAAPKYKVVQKED